MDNTGVKSLWRINSIKEYFPNILVNCFWELHILANCLFFTFDKLCRVWARLEKHDIWHFISEILDGLIEAEKKIKCQITSLSNLSQTLHSLPKQEIGK